MPEVAGLLWVIAFDEMAVHRIRKIAWKERLGGEWIVINRQPQFFFLHNADCRNLDPFVFRHLPPAAMTEVRPIIRRMFSLRMKPH